MAAHVIGSGGKTIRSIVERTGVKIDVEDDGRINIASSDDAAAQKAISIIQELTATPELDKVGGGDRDIPRAPRVALRPGCKARRLRIPGVFEGGAIRLARQPTLALLRRAQVMGISESTIREVGAEVRLRS